MNKQRIWLLGAVSVLAAAVGCGSSTTTTGGAGGGTTTSTLSTGATTTSSSTTGTTTTSTTTTGTTTTSTTGTTTSTTSTMGGCDGGTSCTMANQCPMSSTKCILATCDTNCCGTAFAALGTTCNDSGGVVCDGQGHCMASHCSDGVKDADETGIDCGGSCDNLPTPKLCPAGEGCITSADCVTQSCNASFMCVTKLDGQECAGAAECTSNACLTPEGGGPTICCHTACTDQGAASCGNDGKCMTNGSACSDYPNNTHCGNTCNDGVLTASGLCSGAGTCSGGTSTCANHLGCAGASCAASCTPNTTTGCASGHTCNAAGTACN